MFRYFNCFVVGLSLFIIWGSVACVPKVKVKTQVGHKINKQRATLAAQPCIKGHVVDEKGKGVSYVFVRTMPKTTPVVTDKSGFFEFCFTRKATDGSTQSVKVPLKTGVYTIMVKKEGFNARPQKAHFVGRMMTLDKIKLIEKSIPLGEIQETKKPPKERKLPSGITGTFPKGS